METTKRKRVKMYQQEVRYCGECPDEMGCDLASGDEIPEGCPLADA